MFCDELPTFLREHQANLYRVLPYFLAKNLAEAIQYIIYPVIFSSITYWLSGYSTDIGAFIFFTIICVLITNTAISISYVMSCVFGLVSVAISVMPIFVVPVMAFGGFFINIKSLPTYFRPIEFLSYFQYGFEALVINEWSRVEKIPGCDSSSKNSTYLKCYSNGNDVIHQLGFNENRMWIDVLILIAMILVFRTIAFIALWIRAKTKK